MSILKRFVLFCLLLLPFCLGAQTLTKVTLKIGGPCLRCAPEKIYNLAKSLPGVSKVQVNNEQQLLNLMISPDVPFELLVKMLNENGYDVNDRLCDRFARYDPCCTQPTAQKQTVAPIKAKDEDEEWEDMILKEISESLENETVIDMDKELEKYNSNEEDDLLDLKDLDSDDNDNDIDPIP